MNHARGFKQTLMLIVGITIATAGILFTLDNLDILNARQFVRYWPIALIAIGVAQLRESDTAAARVRGAIWLVVGSFLLGRAFGLWSFRIRDVWPLLLVLFGGTMVWRAFNAADEPRVGSDAALSATAILGGFDRRLVSVPFRRVDLTAFMGGGKLDLTEASLIDGQGVIDVFAIMGGFEILVPRTWRVIIEATPIMGGCDAKTRDPDDPSAPRLVIRGFIMMGGVDIKN